MPGNKRIPEKNGWLYQTLTVATRRVASVILCGGYSQRTFSRWLARSLCFKERKNVDNHFFPICCLTDYDYLNIALGVCVKQLG